MCQGAAISLRRNLEPRCLQVSAKFSHHGAKSGQVDLVEIGSSGAELLEQTEKMIRGSPDRNRGQTLGIRKSFVGQELFRGERQQQAKVLTRRRCACAFPGEQRAKVWWGQEL